MTTQPLNLHAILLALHDRLSPHNMPPDPGVGRGHALPPGQFIDPHHPMVISHDAIYRPAIDHVFHLGGPTATRKTPKRA